MNKKIISAILAAAMALNTGLVAMATPLSDAQKQEIEQKQSEYKSAEEKLNALEQELQKLQGQAQEIQTLVDKNNSEIGNKENSIKSFEKDMEELQKDLDQKEEMYGKRIRAIYKSGNPGYVEVVLSSRNFSDLVTNVQAVGKLMNLDKQMMNEITTKKKEIDDKKEALKKDINKIKELKTENEAKLKELRDQEAKQKVLVNEANEVQKNIKVDLASKERQMIKYPADVINNPSSSLNDITAARDSLRGIRSQIKVIDKEIVDTIEKANSLIKQKQEQPKKVTFDRGGNQSGGSSSGNTSVGKNTSSILSFAYSLQGKPYVYGASGPNSFDCSGFTQYVFGKAGVGLSRTTFTQVNEGVSVSKSNLQPGDLVFFGSASSPHHVGIYVGGGSYIHAPRTGDVVKISSLSGRSDFSVARRII
ncbi:NlpC/P60 family protein [Clostridium hydrogeniformans]|uniref:C40 family peptidase n=1 Tax=Clostridium hydrogeniformans TaxID=349933 RepID=UPI000480B99A|nr:C40 family peptidase [Clostridium hydrogeniformans]